MKFTFLADRWAGLKSILGFVFSPIMLAALPLAYVGAVLTLQMGEHDAEHAWIALAAHGVGIGGKVITFSVAIFLASVLDRILFGQHSLRDIVYARKGVLESGEDQIRAAVIRARATLYAATLVAIMFGSSF